MKNLSLVKSEHFGEIEADIYSNGDEMFMTINQLAECLGYADRNGVQKIVDRNPYLSQPEFSTRDKLGVVEGNRTVTRERMIFTEDGIYEITMLSSQPKAQEFRSWIRGVLKALRRGETKIKISVNEQSIAEAKLLNARARVAAMWTKLADRVDVPEYKQICASYASTTLAGHEVLPLPQSEQHYYSATEIGKMLGINKTRVGSIANAHNMKTETFGKWFHDKSPYSCKEVDTFKYNDAAVKHFRELLARVEDEVS